MTHRIAERRRAIHTRRTFGERAADAVASAMGSWTFIIAQTVIVAFWMLLNVVAIVHHWDPYPWILLNLLFSTQAAYAAPVIMMSQNRQAAKDRVRDDVESVEVHDLHEISGQIYTLIQQVHELTIGQNIVLDLLQAHLDATHEGATDDVRDG